MVLHSISSDTASKSSSSVKFINKLSTALTIKDDLDGTPVDLVVTETFDAGFFGEHVLETLDHAWTKLLKPGKGSVIPGKVEIFGFLLESEEISSEFHVRDDEPWCPGPLNLWPRWILDEKYHSEKLNVVPHRNLSQDFIILSLNLEDPDQIRKLLTQELKVSISCESESDGTCHGIALWFRLISDEFSLDSLSPSSCWEQMVIPLPSPTALKESQPIHLAFVLRDGFLVSFSVYEFVFVFINTFTFSNLRPST